MRLNARIPDEQARQIEELRQATGGSVSEVVRMALRHYYESVFRRSRGAHETLQRAGFIGCGEADPDLSTRYKDDLSSSLQRKHDHR